jgi:hypothetical protein
MEESRRMSILIDPEISRLLDERGIGLSDVQEVIAFANETGNLFKNRASGRHLAYHRPSKITYWVECEQESESCRLLNAYSHRMKILEGLNVPAESRGETSDWVCVKCNAPLEPATVKLTYLDETFAANIPACPSCQRAFVSEKDAVEKMALAEKMLEDK